MCILNKNPGKTTIRKIEELNVKLTKETNHVAFLTSRNELRDEHIIFKVKLSNI